VTTSDAEVSRARLSVSKSTSERRGHEEAIRMRERQSARGEGEKEELERAYVAYDAQAECIVRLPPALPERIGGARRNEHENHEQRTCAWPHKASPHARGCDALAVSGW
jgi:hypothetical protein